MIDKPFTRVSTSGNSYSGKPAIEPVEIDIDDDIHEVFVNEAKAAEYAKLWRGSSLGGVGHARTWAEKELDALPDELPEEKKNTPNKTFGVQSTLAERWGYHHG